MVLVFVAVFMLLRFMPLEGYFSDEMIKEADEATRMTYLRNLGLLDHPLVQLGRFVKNLFRDDLGRSLTVYPKVPISTLLVEKIPVTAAFGFVSMILGIVFGLSLGLLMVKTKDRLGDHLGNSFILIIRAVPSILYLFVIQVYVSAAFDLPMLFYEDRPESWVLPVISLSLGSVAWYALWLRRFMVDELNQDYVKFAQVNGLSKSAVNRRHIFRNAIIPLVIYLPSDLLLIISGSLVIETLYSIPGTGGLLTTAIFRNTLTKAQRYLSRKDAGEDLFDPEMEALIPLLKREIPAHIHAHRSDDILTALRIVKEFNLRCSIIHTTGGCAIVPQIAAAGIIPIVGPCTGPAGKPETVGGSLALGAKLHEAGVEFCLTTDHDVEALWFLPYFASLTVREGLDEESALRAITINGAKAAGVEDRVGSLKVGKDADIVVFSGHPFHYLTRTSAVFINGKREV